MGCDDSEGPGHAPRYLDVRSIMRITGTLPDDGVLTQNNTWVYCLDEEGFECQDESTLKPQGNANVLDDDTNAVSIKMLFNDGIAGYGLLWLTNMELEIMRFRRSNGNWILIKDMDGPYWHGAKVAYGTEYEEFKDPDLNNSDLFPCKVEILCSNANNLGMTSFVIDSGGEIR